MITTRRGKIEYKLKIPNQEVKMSLFDILIDFLTNQKVEKLKYQDNIYDALYDANLENFKTSLIAMFSKIPYNNLDKIKHYEGYYASVIYVYLQSLGLEIIGEDVTNLGRIDLTVKLENIIYIIEFKMGNRDALKQIKENRYAEKYLYENKEIYLVGINFDEKERNIRHFAWELLDEKNK